MSMPINKRERFLKRLLYGCAAVYIITLFLALYHNFMVKDYNALGMGFVAMLTPLIVPVLFKVLHFQPVYEIYIITTEFTYFASLIGSSLHRYSLTGFDKVLHFSSGWMFTTVAVILFFFIRKSNTFPEKKDFTLFLVFINAVNIAIGEIWEFYEYAMLIFFDNDCINHYTQGVHDTITDVMCATVGGILLTLLIVRYYKSGKSNFFTNVYEKFYERNIKPRMKA